MNELICRIPSALEKDIESYATEVRRFLAGDLPADVFRAKRVPQGIYEQRKNGTYMVRIRIPGGVTTFEQIKMLAVLSRQYANGQIHVTTRQDIQLHDVRIEITHEIMRGLLAVGLTTKGGGGNTVRNIATCPFAGVCKAEHFDVTPFALAVTEYFLPKVGSYNLPRKYKIAFSGCDSDCAFAKATDLGFIAQTRDGKPGFRLYTGGGMGHRSRAGDVLQEWLPVQDAIRAAEAVRRLFDRLGDRSNKHKARLRFAVEKMGIEAFRQAFRAELEKLREDEGSLCAIEPTVRAQKDSGPPSITGGRTNRRLNIVDQSQAGYVTVTIPLPLGFISADDFERIGKIAQKYSAEKCIRTTRMQDLTIRFVHHSDLDPMVEELGQLDLDIDAPDPIDSFVVCAGASTCRLGLCLSRPAARACAEVMDDRDMEALANMKIHISGCPNSCGQHPIAALGCYGATKRKEGLLVPSYRLVFGGENVSKQARLAKSFGTVPARALPRFLKSLLEQYQRERSEDETLPKYLNRTGEERLKQLVDRHSDIPPFDTAPEYYRDWGQEEGFSLEGRGAGECGSGVFDVIRQDLDSARKALESEPFDALDALLPATRSLLITRGTDARDPRAVLSAFEKQFIDTGLISEHFRELADRGRDYLQGRQEALIGSQARIASLVDQVELLFSTLDANLAFHPTAEETCPAPSPSVSVCGSCCCKPVEQQRLDRSIDLRGVGCPMNFVKAKLELEKMQVGESLEIILDEGEPIQNVPPSFEKEGQKVEETDDLGNGHWRVLIRKKR